MADMLDSRVTSSMHARAAASSLKAQSGTSTDPFSAELPSTTSASGRRNRSPPLSQMSQGSVLTTRTWHRRAALLIDLHSRIL
jgi:hypothetical protein